MRARRPKDVPGQALCDICAVSRAGVIAWWRSLWRRSADPAAPLSRWAWTADAVLALLLIASTVNGALNGPADSPAVRPDDLPPMPPEPPGFPPPPLPPPPLDAQPATAVALYVLLGVLTALPLALRRRYPLGAFWTVLVATLLYHAGTPLDPRFTFAACVIAAYSAVLYSPYHRGAVVSVLVGSALVLATHKSTMPDLGLGPIGLFGLIPIGLAANAVHTWKQRARTLEAEQEAATRLAVEQERARIAQELHDVVTHNVSVMVVQAGAARMVMRESPERAETAMRAVEDGGRAAMTDLRHVMGLLTMNGDAPDLPDAEDLAPKPGLDQVPALAERVRDSGVPVELTVTGAPVPLPPGMDLAAYRVVQEALTNTMKHAEGATVAVHVEYSPGRVRVEVGDTGGGASPAARTGNGHGLIGLRERLAVYGGTLEAGPRPGGGYRVRADLPRADR